LIKNVSFGWYRIQSLAILLLFFTLPFPRKFSTIAICIVLFFTLKEFFKKESYAKITRIHWFLPSLFLFYVASCLFSGASWSFIEKRTILIAAPLIFVLNPIFFTEKLRSQIYRSFILGTFLAIVICFGRALTRSFRFEAGEWHFNPKVIQDNYDFLTSSVMGGNFFFGSEFSWFLHTTYFGMYIVLAQAMLYEIFKTKTDKKHKLFLVVVYALLFIPLFLLSSKAAIFSALLLTFYILFTSKAVAKLRLLIMAGLAVVSVLFFLFNPRLKDLADNFFNNGQILNPKAKYGHALRLLSWDASIDVIKNNWLFGVGEANKETALLEMYVEKGYEYPAQWKLNSHNQYLDFLLSGGIIGLGLFVTGLVTLMIRAIRQDNFLLTIFVGLMMFNALFENLLTLYSGIFFFSLFIVLLDFKRQPNHELEINS